MIKKNEIMDAQTIVENQLLDTLPEVKQQIANGMTMNFKETCEPPGKDLSYSGEAVAQLLGAYAQAPKVAVFARVTHWDFPEEAFDFWNAPTSLQHRS